MMITFKAIRVFQFLKQVSFDFSRCLTDGVILKSTKKLPKPKSILNLTARKRFKKKPTKRKSQIVVKKLSDDIEGIWLENLNRENLKLYRKTSFGSFRKIDTSKLLERLREIYPSKFGNEEISDKLSAGETGPAVQLASTESSDENERASPYMSSFLVKHMTQFPLFKTKCDNPLSEFLKEEKKDFGKVDSAMFPSVTGILSETMSECSKAKLKEWKENMIEKMGKDRFNEYQADPEIKIESMNEIVKTSRKKKSIIIDLMNQGSRFHSTLKRYLEIADKQLVTIDPQIEGCWKSLENLLPDISNVSLVEECIYHPILSYRGVVDCVAAYRGTPCVIEWKKSNKPKTNLSATYDAPLQLCAYLGALTWNKSLCDLEIKNGLVVIAYTDGSPANVFLMDLESCEVHWILWLRRLQSYWLKKSSTLIQHEV